MRNIDSLVASENKELICYANIISKFIKRRKEMNLSQNELAKGINVSSSTISRIENFVIKPTFDLLTKISEYLGLDITISDCTNEHTTNYYKYDTGYQSGKFTLVHYGEAGKSTRTPLLHSINLNKNDFNDKIDYISLINDVYNNISFICEEKNDYISFIELNLDKYINILNNYSINSKLIEIIIRFKKESKIIIDQYYLGKHELAYRIFSDCLDRILDINFFTSKIESDLVLYRSRTKKENCHYNCEDMFHIPFNKRFLVSTQRYSFPGLPCLYLGSSREVCDLEVIGEEKVYATIEYHMDSEKSEFDEIFDLTKIFDKNIENMSCKEYNLFLLEFPLVFVCSTKIEYKTDMKKVNFRPEYIMPQLLLEYVLKKNVLKDNIIGLKYYSNNINFFEYWINGNNETLSNMCNYVFPARTTLKKKGYCDFLSQKFKIKHIE